MSIEGHRVEFPKLFDKFDEDMSELRYILIIDENFNDVDSDEFDAIDPDDYNYMVYITQLLQDTIGQEKFEQLADIYESHSSFSDFYDAGDGLYGIMTELSEDKISKVILGEIEKIL